jgi:hypothetical protein
MLRSIAPFLQLSAPAEIATFVRVCDQSDYSALKCISASCTIRPKAVCVQFLFILFNY